MDTIDHKGILLHRWQYGSSTFIARPGLGARLMSWNFKTAKGDERPVIHWPQEADFNTFQQVRGGNPILFPFSGRSFYKGEKGVWSDQGMVRSMPIHGFANNCSFDLLEVNDRGFTAELKVDEECLAIYPYDYSFRVRYIFNERSLQVFLTLENLDKQPILWSAGHHFYFSLPWKPATGREDYFFRIPAATCYSHAVDGSLAPVGQFRTEDSFGNPENNDRIFTGLKDGHASVNLANSEERLVVCILKNTGTASPENAFVIWSEFAESPFYCVEPWMGPPNSVEHGKGLHKVMPGESACFAVEVSI